MADLFHENTSRNDDGLLNSILKLMSEQRRERWVEREEEAGKFMSEYIGKHPEELHGAITGFGQIDACLLDMMEMYRADHLGHEHEDERDDFVFARTIAILGAARHLLEEMHETEGTCFIHLCDRGCEAVRAIAEHERGN